jgi:hypothetical protein
MWPSTFEDQTIEDRHRWRGAIVGQGASVGSVASSAGTDKRAATRRNSLDWGKKPRTTP